MIAEQRPVRRAWSMAAMVLASLTAAVACTDAVRGQKPPEARPAAGVVADTPAPGSPFASQPAGGFAAVPAAAAQDERLTKRIPELKLDLQLGAALDFMREQTKLNLFVDYKALEAAGVEMDAAVSLDLKNITTDQAFRMIGKAAAPTGLELGAKLDGDVVVFTVLGQSGPIVPATETPGGITPGTGFAPPLPVVARRTNAEPTVVRVYNVDRLVGGDPARLNTLVSVMQGSLNLTKTSAVTGMQPFNGKLVVTASQDVQNQVADLLKTLTDAAPATTKPAAAANPKELPGLGTPAFKS